MNIGVVNRFFLKDGGIPVAARSWVAGFEKQEVNTIVFASDIEATDSRQHVKFVKVFTKRVTTLDIGGFIFAFFLFFKLLLIHTRQKLDVLQVHDSTAFFGAYIFGKLYRVPVIIFFHGWIYNPFREAAYRKSQTLIYKLSAKFCAKFADKICCVSQEIAEGMKMLGAVQERVYLFPNSVDLAIWRDKGIKYSPQKEKMVLYVGRFGKEKGLKYLIRAIPEVITILTNTQFVFVGGGQKESEKQYLMKLIEELGVMDNVTFAGRVPHDHLSEYYSKADALVMPSLSEGHAIVPLEALACGTPVVGTKIEGIMETVQDGHNGFLVEPGDYQAIATAVIKILSNEALLKELSMNAHPSVKRFSWENTIHRFLNLYKDSV